MRLRWLLPQSVEVLGILHRQATITIEGMDAFLEWADGEAEAGDRVRAAEHRADDCKRELRKALSEAFSTPLDAEDIYELSQGLDEILNSAKDTVGEAEAMRTSPDGATAAMATELAEGTRQLGQAFALIEDDGGASAEAADRAVKQHRNLEHTYRKAMSALIDVDDLREVTARRELYRRLARTSEHLARVGERVWYSVLKER
jgi:uncharacterized protein